MKISNARSLLIFGTDTGNTETVGESISAELAKRGCDLEMVDVVGLSDAHLEQAEFIVMGIPTWDFGGIQGDWEDIETEIQKWDLTGKTVALYGLGDQLGYGYYFVDAMAWLYHYVIAAGARVIGHWSTESYFYEESRAVNEEKTYFCGLAIDDDQQFELTDQRIEQWVEQIQAEYEGSRPSLKDFALIQATEETRESTA